MNIFSLVYVSSASGLYDKDVYRDIALRSGEYNQSRSITGMLLLYNETVIQFLEGSEDEVEALYARIEVDERHKNPIVLSRRNIGKREFPEWTMGYEEVVTPPDAGVLFTLTAQSLKQRIPSYISSRSQALINGFSRSSALV